MHKKPLTELEKTGLEAHGLPVGTPSQCSDSFRNGMAWVLGQLDAALEREQNLAAHGEEVMLAGQALREPWDLSTILGPATRRKVERWDQIVAEMPDTSSLARRDLNQRADELDEVAKYIGNMYLNRITPDGLAVSLRMRAKDKRREAEELK